MHLTPAKLAEDGITSYTLSAAQGNLPTFVTFTVFSLVIIVFGYMTFNLNHFDGNASNLSFRR